MAKQKEKNYRKEDGTEKKIQSPQVAQMQLQSLRQNLGFEPKPLFSYELCIEGIIVPDDI
jgi:hypothetical protein